MAGVAVTVALQASWELALPLVAFAALIAGALLSSWWLRRSIRMGWSGAEEAPHFAATLPQTRLWVAGAEVAPRFATLPQTQLWVAVSAAASGLSLAAGLMVVQPWWHLFSDADTLARTVSVVVLTVALLAVFLPRVMVRSRTDLPYPFRMVAAFLVFGGLGFFPAGSGMVLVWTAALEVDSGSLAAARRSVGALVEQRRSLLLFLGVGSFIVFSPYCRRQRSVGLSLPPSATTRPST